jgi:hypothetical protein
MLVIGVIVLLGLVSSVDGGRDVEVAFGVCRISLGF